MRSLFEFLSTSVKPSIIHATDDTIKQIVKDELDRLGHDADLNHIDTSNITNMIRLFNCSAEPDTHLGKEYRDLNPDISGWNVSKVEDMSWMFYFCENFNCDISNWDIRNVEDMRYMFAHCKKFNQDLSQWDLSKVKDINNMFNDCIKMPSGHFPKAWVHYMFTK